jgi:hypothetical protein
MLLVTRLAVNPNVLKVEKFLPSDRLAPYVREYLIIDAHEGAESKALPDTALVMSFRFRGDVFSK